MNKVIIIIILSMEYLSFHAFIHIFGDSGWILSLSFLLDSAWFFASCDLGNIEKLSYITFFT